MPSWEFSLNKNKSVSKNGLLAQPILHYRERIYYTLLFDRCALPFAEVDFLATTLEFKI